jgi:hypothetical protein
MIDGHRAGAAFGDVGFPRIGRTGPGIVGGGVLTSVLGACQIVRCAAARRSAEEHEHGRSASECECEATIQRRCTPPHPQSRMAILADCRSA